MLVITATASKSSRMKLKNKLALIDSIDIVESPDRENIKLFVRKLKSTLSLEDCFQWLYNLVEERQNNAPRHLVFFNSINSCSKAYSMFRLNLSTEEMAHVQMFHSCSPEDIKESVRNDMSSADGTIRVLLASSAAGMGVNYANLNNIVHFGVPRDMDSFVQQLGRAGRDGSQAFHLMLFNGRHIGELRPKHKYDEMRSYAQNIDKCRRQMILDSYQVKSKLTVAHLCCDICAAACKCGSEDCESHVLPFIDELAEDVGIVESGDDHEARGDTDMWGDDHEARGDTDMWDSSMYISEHTDSDFD